MISGLFLADFRKMKADGLELEPGEIIRLNALAVRAKLAARPFVCAHLPRVVFLDGFTLREPAIAHELWIERIGQYVDLDSDLNWRSVHAYALSREPGKLPDPLKAEKCIRKVFAFARSRLYALTREQLRDALDYVLYGPDWTAGEFPPERRREPPEKAADGYSPAVGVLTDARARRIGISLADAMRMTCSEILEAVQTADVLDGNRDFEAAKNNLLGDYFRARDEVRESATKRKALKDAGISAAKA